MAFASAAAVTQRVVEAQRLLVAPSRVMAYAAACPRSSSDRRCR